MADEVARFFKALQYKIQNPQELPHFNYLHPTTNIQFILSRISERKGHNGSIYQLFAASDGGFYAVAGDGWLVHWPADADAHGKLVAQVDNGQLFSILAVPEKGLILAGSLDGGLHWLYPNAPKKNRHLAHHRKGIFSIIQVGEDKIFCGGGDGLLSCWSLQTGRVTESLPLSASAIRSLCYFASQNTLIAGGSDHHIHLIDATSLAIKQSLHAHDNSVFCLSKTADNKLISSGRDARLKRWVFNQSGHIETADKNIPAHNATINDLAFSPDGKFLVTASRDKTIRLWDAKSLKLLKVAEPIRDRGHVNSVNTLLWLDNKRFITAGDDRRILEWEIRTS